MQRVRIGVFVVAGFMAGFAQSVQASRFDVVSGRTGGPANGGSTCRACHGNAVGSGLVEIIGAPSQYRANVVYDLTVRVSDSTRLGAGFQLSVEDAGGNHIGTLSLIDAVETELNDNPNYINHTSDGVDASVAAWAGNGNSYSYPVRWTAPSTDMGTITFWAAGNAINNNFSNDGDIIYLTNQSASFTSVPAASTWGMIVLALCVMTAGTIVGIHRRPALVPVLARSISR